MWWCMNEAIRMQLSAFVDGELPETEAELLLRRLSQDAELRQQVAEFMAIGRAIRGDVQVTGIDNLRGRIAGALDVTPEIDELAEDLPVDSRFVRPLFGFAIAATVALVAIFGLRQMSVVEGVGVDAQGSQFADVYEASSYTQKQPEDVLEDELLREMRRMHDASISDPRIKTRLTSVEISQELLEKELVDEKRIDEELADKSPVNDAAVE